MSAETDQFFAAMTDLLERQDRRCAICGSAMLRPVIDHDHETGMVRGILCLKCNLLLGCAQDSVLLLQRVIAYLGAEQTSVTYSSRGARALQRALDQTSALKRRAEMIEATVIAQEAVMKMMVRHTKDLKMMVRHTKDRQDGAPDQTH